MPTVDVSPLVTRYRDAARSLWNSTFLSIWNSDLSFPGLDQMSDWDFRDRYEDLCVELFSALVIKPATVQTLRIWPAYRGDALPLSELAVVPRGHSELLVAEAESNSFRTYDFSLTNSKDAKLDMRFLSFFDYDVRNLRDLEYVQAVVVGCDERPLLVGRKVLMRATGANYVLSVP